MPQMERVMTDPHDQESLELTDQVWPLLSKQSVAAVLRKALRESHAAGLFEANAIFLEHVPVGHIGTVQVRDRGWALRKRAQEGK